MKSSTYTSYLQVKFVCSKNCILLIFLIPILYYNVWCLQGRILAYCFLINGRMKGLFFYPLISFVF